MMSMLLKNVILNNKNTNILIKDNKFAKISDEIMDADKVIDCSGKAILPAFYNTHSHAGMSIFRGVSDDKNLFDWLNKDIFPREAKLTAEMIYKATKFSVLEMIKSGSVFFSDMYFECEKVMQAVNEMKIRAAIALSTCDLGDENKRKAEIIKVQKFMEAENPNPTLIQKVLSAHAIYSASPEMIKYNVKTANEHNLKLHIHACETKKEVEDSYKIYGCSPIKHLYNLGALGENTILAHAIHLDDEDIDLIVKTGTYVSTNPSSNYKLASGLFMMKKLLARGVKITLGTDGMASNNNVSMIDEMKLCALSAKIESNDPTAGSAEDIFKIATFNGAKAFNINAGEIKEGKDADCIMVNLENHFLVPNYNLISNMVYSADSSCVDTVICNGEIVMQSHMVKGEKEITDEIKELSKFFK